MSNSSAMFAAGSGRTGLFLTACGLLFLTQKMLVGMALWHTVGATVSALVAGASLALRIGAYKSGAPRLRDAESRLLWCHAAAIIALCLYALQTQWGRELLSIAAPEAGERDTYGVVLAVGWPILFLLGTLPMVVLELAAYPMRLAGSTDSRRLTAALRTGLTCALAVSCLFLGNYLATRHDIQRDLAYFQVTKPGTATLNVVKHLEEGVEVVLFFPRANDVLERIQSYMSVLEGQSNQLKVTAADRLLKPALARRHRIRENGAVVIARGTKRETLKISTDFKKARRQLTKLDGEFLKALTKVATPKRLAYLVTGHGELNEAIADDGSKTKARDRLAREVLALQGYQVKNLSMADGLATEVPNDANLILILGATKPFLPGEEAALQRWLTHSGGRLLLALEPEGGDNAKALLAALGLTFSANVMADAKYHLRHSFDLSDRYLVATSSFSSHPSVKTLSRNSRKAAIAFNRTGSLEKIAKNDKATHRKTELTVRTMPSSWGDTNGNHEFDSGSEKRKVHHLAAAITFTKGAKEKEPGRAVVLADSDVFSDSLMRFRGNLFLLSDTLRFLAGEEKLAGTIESEEDTPVEHTQDKDIVWFYGTVFIIPMGVLLGGLGYVRRRRRQRQ